MELAQTTRIDREKPLAIMIHQAEPVVIKEPHAGDQCPVCGVGQMDYDGMLNLACGVCGFMLSGCFT